MLIRASACPCPASRAASLIVTIRARDLGASATTVPPPISDVHPCRGSTLLPFSRCPHDWPWQSPTLSDERLVGLLNFQNAMIPQDRGIKVGKSRIAPAAEGSSVVLLGQPF